MSREVPEPWAAFLGDLDQKLEARVELHCIGGFVASIQYGLDVPTWEHLAVRT